MEAGLLGLSVRSEGLLVSCNGIEGQNMKESCMVERWDCGEKREGRGFASFGEMVDEMDGGCATRCSAHPEQRTPQ